MKRLWLSIPSILLSLAWAAAAQSDVVFRSDVSLVRVDVQVLDSAGRAVTGLHREDFLLREDSRDREIRNFANENMPADVLILVDVSTSMRPHVERVAAASRDALNVLGSDDRVAMMVFDRQVRVRMPFRSANSQEAQMEFGRLLNQESFSGGTDITRALYEAANFMKRSARKEARRAVVILTDDQTEFNRDEYGLVRAMTAADTVVSLLLAPDMIGMFSGGQSGGGGGSWPRGGGGQGGGGIGGTLGDILLGGGGRRYPGGGGGRYPGGGGGGQIPGQRRGGTQSAGIREVASRTGGDTIQIDDASAFETTLARIRQRYALYFTVPDGARAGQERTISVELAGTARRRYANADVRYRRTYVVPEGAASDGSVTVSQTPSPSSSNPVSANGSRDDEEGSGGPNPPVIRRRPAVNERTGSGPSAGTVPAVAAKPPAATATVNESAAAAAPPQPVPEKKGGWRRASPEDLKAQQ